MSRIWSVSHSIAGCRPSPVSAFVARMCQGLFCIRSSPSPATNFTVVRESGRSILFARKRMGSLRPETFTSIESNCKIRRILDSLNDLLISILPFCALNAFYRYRNFITRRTCHIGMLQEHVQLFFHDNQPQLIAAVDYEDDPVAVPVIMLPQWSMTVVARHVKRGEIDIFN